MFDGNNRAGEETFFSCVVLNWYVNVECATNQVFHQSFKLELDWLL